MALFAGTFKEAGEAPAFPDCFELQKPTGPGLLRTTGDPVPDCTGTYKYAGQYNDQPYYLRLDAAFAIWSPPAGGVSVISTAPGQPYPGYWTHVDTVEGTYTPQGDYTGNPQVAVIPISIIRLRSPKHKPGRHARVGWFDAGPTWEAGWYEQSPAHKRCKDDWQFLMRWYADVYPRHPMYVNTYREGADVTVLLPAEACGKYMQLHPAPHMSPWVRGAPAWYIFWHGAQAAWFLAQSYPDPPTEDQDYWRRDDVAWYGTYAPGGTAAGNATIISDTFDGKYFYVGQHAEQDHWYNKNRTAHVWWDPDENAWILGQTFPTLPDPGLVWWKRTAPLIYGEYLAQGVADGTAELDVAAGP